VSSSTEKKNCKFNLGYATTSHINKNLEWYGLWLCIYVIIFSLFQMQLKLCFFMFKIEQCANILLLINIFSFILFTFVLLPFSCVHFSDLLLTTLNVY
jgi:hypothetical protein